MPAPSERRRGQPASTTYFPVTLVGRGVGLPPIVASHAHIKVESDGSWLREPARLVWLVKSAWRARLDKP